MIFSFIRGSLLHLSLFSQPSLRRTQLLPIPPLFSSQPIIAQSKTFISQRFYSLLPTRTVGFSCVFYATWPGHPTLSRNPSCPTELAGSIIHSTFDLAVSYPSMNVLHAIIYEKKIVTLYMEQSFSFLLISYFCLSLNIAISDLSTNGFEEMEASRLEVLRWFMGLQSDIFVTRAA